MYLLILHNEYWLIFPNLNKGTIYHNLVEDKLQHTDYDYWELKQYHKSQPELTVIEDYAEMEKYLIMSELVN